MRFFLLANSFFIVFSNNMNIISKYNTNLTFKSKINPIKPYKLQTRIGEISISEVNFDKELTCKFIRRLNKFFCKNFAQDTKDTNYSIYSKGSLEQRLECEKDFYTRYLRIFKNPKLRDKSTILIAKDSNNNLQGACISTPYFEVPECLNTTLWIDSLAVNKKYRNARIASELLNKTIESNKETFTDVFLTGTISAKKFYEKMGFKILNKAHSAQKTVYDFLRNKRYDIPKYVLPFTKPIQNKKTRWYENSAKAIRNQF